MNWYVEALKKYAVFNGRARRQEYWMFFLINLIIAIIIGFVEKLIGRTGLFSSIYTLVLFLPGIAVTVRRLHDTDRSGWWLLIGFVPLIGSVILLIFMVLDSQEGSNAYGPNPKDFPL